MSTSDTDKPPVCPSLPLPAAPPVDAQPGTELRDEGEQIVVARVARRVRPEVLLHVTFLCIAAVVMLASFSLTIRNGDQVVVPLLDASLPGTCTFRKLTGYPCPGCGLTRSFISMAHGRIGDAWRYNPAGFFFFGVVAFQIPYRVYQLVRIRRGLGEHRFVRFDNWVLLGLVVVLVIQWLYAMVVAGT